MSKVLITPEAVLSYPSLFNPRAFSEGDTPKYEATFVFPAEADLTQLRQAVLEVGKKKWGDEKFGTMLKAGKVKIPFRSDGEEKGYPEGSVFFAARSENKPGVVSIYPSEHDPSKPALITDEAKVYPGVIVKGLVSCYAYTKPQPGITFGLEGLQVIRDGERLDGRVNVQSAFDVDESAFANLDSTLAAMEEAQDEAPDTGTGSEGDDILALLGGGGG